MSSLEAVASPSTIISERFETDEEPKQKSLHFGRISTSGLRKPGAGVKDLVAKQQGNLWRKRDVFLQYFTNIYRLSGVNESFGAQTPFAAAHMQTGIALLQKNFRRQQMSPSICSKMPWKRNDNPLHQPSASRNYCKCRFFFGCCRSSSAGNNTRGRLLRIESSRSL